MAASRHVVCVALLGLAMLTAAQSVQTFADTTFPDWIAVTNTSVSISGCTFQGSTTLAVSELSIADTVFSNSLTIQAFSPLPTTCISRVRMTNVTLMQPWTLDLSSLCRGASIEVSDSTVAGGAGLTGNLVGTSVRFGGSIFLGDTTVTAPAMDRGATFHFDGCQFSARLRLEVSRLGNGSTMVVDSSAFTSLAIDTRGSLSMGDMEIGSNSSMAVTRCTFDGTSFNVVAVALTTESSVLNVSRNTLSSTPLMIGLMRGDAFTQRGIVAIESNRMNSTSKDDVLFQIPDSNSRLVNGVITFAGNQLYQGVVDLRIGLDNGSALIFDVYGANVSSLSINIQTPFTRAADAMSADYIPAVNLPSIYFIVTNSMISSTQLRFEGDAGSIHFVVANTTDRGAGMTMLFGGLSGVVTGAVHGNTNCTLGIETGFFAPRSILTITDNVFVSPAEPAYIDATVRLVATWNRASLRLLNNTMRMSGSPQASWNGPLQFNYYSKCLSCSITVRDRWYDRGQVLMSGMTVAGNATIDVWLPTGTVLSGVSLPLGVVDVWLPTHAGRTVLSIIAVGVTFEGDVGIFGDTGGSGNISIGALVLSRCVFAGGPRVLQIQSFSTVNGGSIRVTDNDLRNVSFTMDSIVSGNATVIEVSGNALSNPVTQYSTLGIDGLYLRGNSSLLITANSVTAGASVGFSIRGYNLYLQDSSLLWDDHWHRADSPTAAANVFWRIRAAGSTFVTLRLPEGGVEGVELTFETWDTGAPVAQTTSVPLAVGVVLQCERSTTKKITVSMAALGDASTFTGSFVECAVVSGGVELSIPGGHLTFDGNTVSEGVLVVSLTVNPSTGNFIAITNNVFTVVNAGYVYAITMNGGDMLMTNSDVRIVNNTINASETSSGGISIGGAMANQSRLDVSCNTLSACGPQATVVYLRNSFTVMESIAGLHGNAMRCSAGANLIIGDDVQLSNSMLNVSVGESATSETGGVVRLILNGWPTTADAAPPLHTDVALDFRVGPWASLQALTLDMTKSGGASSAFILVNGSSIAGVALLNHVRARVAFIMVANVTFLGASGLLDLSGLALSRSIFSVSIVGVTFDRMRQDDSPWNPTLISMRSLDLWCVDTLPCPVNIDQVIYTNWSVGDGSSESQQATVLTYTTLDISEGSTLENVRLRCVDFDGVQPQVPGVLNGLDRVLSPLVRLGPTVARRSQISVRISSGCSSEVSLQLFSSVLALLAFANSTSLVVRPKHNIRGEGENATLMLHFLSKANSRGSFDAIIIDCPGSGAGSTAVLIAGVSVREVTATALDLGHGGLLTISDVAVDTVSLSAINGSGIVALRGILIGTTDSQTQSVLFGVLSSAVTVLMLNISGTALTSFSVQYDGPDNSDERSVASYLIGHVICHQERTGGMDWRLPPRSSLAILDSALDFGSVNLPSAPNGTLLVANTNFGASPVAFSTRLWFKFVNSYLDANAATYQGDPPAPESIVVCLLFGDHDVTDDFATKTGANAVPCLNKENAGDAFRSETDARAQLWGAAAASSNQTSAKATAILAMLRAPIARVAVPSRHGVDCVSGQGAAPRSDGARGSSSVTPSRSISVALMPSDNGTWLTQVPSHAAAPPTLPLTIEQTTAPPTDTTAALPPDGTMPGTSAAPVATKIANSTTHATPRPDSTPDGVVNGNRSRVSNATTATALSVASSPAALSASSVAAASATLTLQGDGSASAMQGTLLLLSCGDHVAPGAVVPWRLGDGALGGLAAITVMMAACGTVLTVVTGIFMAVKNVSMRTASGATGLPGLLLVPAKLLYQGWCWEAAAAALRSDGGGGVRAAGCSALVAAVGLPLGCGWWKVRVTSGTTEGDRRVTFEDYGPSYDEMKVADWMRSTVLPTGRWRDGEAHLGTETHHRFGAAYASLHGSAPAWAVALGRIEPIVVSIATALANDGTMSCKVAQYTGAGVYCVSMAAALVAAPFRTRLNNAGWALSNALVAATCAAVAAGSDSIAESLLVATAGLSTALTVSTLGVSVFERRVRRVAKRKAQNTNAPGATKASALSRRGQPATARPASSPSPAGNGQQLEMLAVPVLQLSTATLANPLDARRAYPLAQV